MSYTFRHANPADAPECGRICYEAFGSIQDAHNFARDFPSADISAGLYGMLIENPGFFGVVGEWDGRIVGSNFMDERSVVYGIGPITVDPAVQNKGIGRLLMRQVMDRGTARNAAGMRLVQEAFHNRSLCLYTSLGFQTREPLSLMQGLPLKVGFAGYEVRPAELTDVEACSRLCRNIHGFDRAVELKEAIGQSTATVVLHLGEITGYATQVGFFAHSIARTNQDLIALIAAASEFTGSGFLLPTRNYEVLSWCLAKGLRLVKQMTLMTVGLYSEPAGAYLPSILY